MQTLSCSSCGNKSRNSCGTFTLLHQHDVVVFAVHEFCDWQNGQTDSSNDFFTTIGFLFYGRSSFIADGVSGFTPRQSLKASAACSINMPNPSMVLPALCCFAQVIKAVSVSLYIMS